MASHRGIIFVTSINMSKHSAAVVNIMEMCNAFAKSGAKVILVAPEINTTTDKLFEYYRVQYPFEFRRVTLPPLFARGTVPGCAMVFATLSAGLVLGLAKEHTIYSRDPWIFTILAFLTGKCCFFESHQFRFRSRVQTFIYRFIIGQGMRRENARMICISATLKSHWEGYGIEPGKMVVVHDAANPDHYCSAISKTEARKELRLPADRPIVAYTGSLLPSKGVDVLVRCANRIPDVSFVVVGGEKSQIEELQKLCTKDNVIFTGHCPPRLIPVYQAAADVLALPNTHGGNIDDVTSPMKLFEYMAAERPIVATDMPSLMEVLQHDKNALISPAGDDYQLSRNVERLVREAGIGARLATSAKNELKNYTWDERVSKITSMLPP